MGPAPQAGRPAPARTHGGGSSVPAARSSQRCLCLGARCSRPALHAQLPRGVGTAPRDARAHPRGWGASAPHPSLYSRIRMAGKVPCQGSQSCGVPESHRRPPLPWATVKSLVCLCPPPTFSGPRLSCRRVFHLTSLPSWAPTAPSVPQILPRCWVAVGGWLTAPKSCEWLTHMGSQSWCLA